MANKNLTDLTARTATADSDLIHVNSGGTDYKETKANFLQDVNSSISSLNSSLTQSSTGTITMSSYVTSHSYVLEKRSGIVFLSGYVGFYTNTLPAEVVFMTLPAGFRPDQDQWTMIAMRPTSDGGDINQARGCIIKSNGEVIMHNGGSIQYGFLRFSVSFPAAN